ncbi:MAG TPA: tetratricopeptide repeat protein, partial [Verrucomicrobiae bacterium]|nr:tetratricopeptide repeat protein [Verrucomicrobiae bacterium]
CAKRARQIAEVTASRTMPPWLPDPKFGHYEGERLLTAKQIQVLADWAAGGAPEGNPDKLPKLPVWPEGWTLGKPDLVVQTPQFNVPAEGRDVYQNFVVPVPISSVKYVGAVEVDPGNPKVAHHAFILFDRTKTAQALDEKDPSPGFEGMELPSGTQSPDGHFLSWQPGKRFSRNPEGLSWRLHPGSDLVFQMHMQPSGKPERIQSSIAFFFTDQPPVRFPQKVVLSSYRIDIPAGEQNYVVTNSFRVPVDVEILSVLPHAHYLGKELEGYVLLPDGQTNWLIRIPDWNFNWQGDYRLRTPVLAPRGSTLVMRFTYDNSVHNIRNPNHPPIRVQYGPQTRDEMAELWVQTLPRNPAELPALREEVEKQTLDLAISYAEYRLRQNPHDAKAHLKYGQALLGKGNRSEARAHLKAAAEEDPKNDEPQYYLGLIARVENQLKSAAMYFTEAARLNPRNSKALGNLGLINLQERNLAAAENYFLQTIEIDPGDAIAQDGLGILYFKQGKLARAEGHFRKAAAADPNDREIQLHLAQLEAARRTQK